MSSNIYQTTPQPTAGADQGSPNSLQTTSVAKQQFAANSVEERDAVRSSNATSLSNPEWENVDEAVMPPLRRALVLANAFEGAGLTHDLQWWETESTWRLRGGMTDAEHAVSLSTRSEMDKVGYAKQGIAVPYSIKDYFIDDAELEKSRQTGQAIDTTLAAEAGRQVGELVDATLLYGAPDLTVRMPNGNTLSLPGLLNVEGKFEMPTSGTWNDGTTVYKDLTEAANTLSHNEFGVEGSGGYWLLYGDAQDSQFDQDYSSTNVDRSTREKIESISKINRMIHVPQMPDGTVLLMRPTSDVVDMARLPDGPLNIQWSTHGETRHEFKVYHLAAPRVKHTLNDAGEARTGILKIAGIA